MLSDHGNTETKVDAQGGMVAPPAVTSEHYCHGSTDGWFYMMNANDTRIRWKREIGPVHHGAAMSRTTVYVANRIGVLHAFEIKKGRPRWQFKAEADTVSAPILVKSLVACAADFAAAPVVTPIVLAERDLLIATAQEGQVTIG